MGIRAPKNSHVASDEQPENTGLQELVQHLVHSAAEVNAFRSTREEGDGEEVILDIDVDGSRYLLIRLPESWKARVQLSPREHEIVRMVALGHPNKVIAGVLSISTWTVCTHLRRI